MTIMLDRPFEAEVLVLPVAARTVSLLHPAFEQASGPFWRLWWQRATWRSQLAEQFGGKPERLLADFGLDRDALDDYLARPFWRA